MQRPDTIESPQTNLRNVVAKSAKREATRIWYYQLPKMLRAYFATRFPRLLFLWFAIFSAALLVDAAVNVLSRGQLENVINATTFSAFADAKLLIALSLGTIVVQFSHRLLKRTITIDESQQDWGESTVDAVMDEISAAATHFACILIAAWLFTCFSTLHFGWDSNLWLSFLAVGVAVYTFDARANYRRFSLPIPGEFEARLSTPVEGAKFAKGEETEFRGTFYKRPPRGYEIWLIRRWAENADDFYPVSKLKLHRESATLFRFSVMVEVWGESGDNRFFELWVVGPQGLAVFEAWVNGNSRFVALQKAKGWNQKYLYPSLVKTTDDMVIVHQHTRVSVGPAKVNADSGAATPPRQSPPDNATGSSACRCCAACCCARKLSGGNCSSRAASCSAAEPEALPTVQPDRKSEPASGAAEGNPSVTASSAAAAEAPTSHGHHCYYVDCRCC